MSDAKNNAPSGQSRPELVLYKFDSCPYCQVVMREIDKLGLSIAYKDTIQDPAARQELLSKGGKTQVPCLFVNGRPLYESAAIVQYLRTL